MEDKLYCPKCGSGNLTAEKKGFGVGKAIIGTALFGVAGALAGTIGSNEIELTCLNCENSFKVNEASKVNLNNPEVSAQDKINQRIKELASKKQVLQAVKYYADIYKVPMLEANKQVEQILKG